jgi:hypothetical protein
VYRLHSPVYKAALLKSKLKHNGNWLASACHLHYCPTVCFCHLHLIVLSFPHGKIQHVFQKYDYLNLLFYCVCLELLNLKLHKSGECLYSKKGTFYILFNPTNMWGYES